MGLSETDVELFELAQSLPAAEEYDGDDLIIVEEIVERWMASMKARGSNLDLRTVDDPEANGRKPEAGDVRFTLHLPLEDGSTLVLRMGQKGRDTVFGMLIADCQDSGETEPG